MITIKDFLPFREEIKAMVIHYNCPVFYVEDVVQDVYIKLMDMEKKEGSLSRIEWNGKPNKSYLFLVVRSLVANLLRKNKIRAMEEAAFMLSNELRESVDWRHDKEKFENFVLECLQDMHFFPRMIFEAYIKDNHSIRSLSRATKISEQTIRREISYVKRQVKNRAEERQDS